MDYPSVKTAILLTVLLSCSAITARSDVIGPKTFAAGTSAVVGGGTVAELSTAQEVLVQTSADVTFKATRSIRLKQGFKAGAGSRFVALIIDPTPVGKSPQDAVFSGDRVLVVGEPFAPLFRGGSGSGAWQYVVSDPPSTYWPLGAEAGTRLESGLALSWTPLAIRTYTFYVRKYGDEYYDISAVAGPYTLTVIADPFEDVTIDLDGDLIPDEIERQLGIENDPAIRILEYEYDKVDQLKLTPTEEYVKDPEGNIKEVKKR
jgi:hypothetical protein